MGLIRTGVVLAAAVALMPADKEGQEKLFKTTASAVQWTVTFCDRNGEMCQKSAELWQIFKAKAQFAAGLAYDAAMHYAAATPVETQGTATPLVHPSTLSPSDLAPAWQGKPARPGI